MDFDISRKNIPLRRQFACNIKAYLLNISMGNKMDLLNKFGCVYAKFVRKPTSFETVKRTIDFLQK